jgi:hypothetical protein
MRICLFTLLYVCATVGCGGSPSASEPTSRATAPFGCIPCQTPPVTWHHGSGSSTSILYTLQGPPSGQYPSYLYSTIVVPPIPPNADDHGNSYWNAIQSATSEDFIVQPVLSFGNHWDCGLANGQWFLVAYELDNNTTPHCGNLVGVNPGDTIALQITMQSHGATNSWYVTASDTTLGGGPGVTSTLTVSTPDEPMEYITAQEWVHANSCASTPSATISYIQALSSQGNVWNYGPWLPFAPTMGTDNVSYVCPYNAAPDTHLGPTIGTTTFTD